MLKFRILALGQNDVIDGIAETIGKVENIEITRESDIVEAIVRLRKEKFEIALVDGHYPDLATVCYRIHSLHHTPLALLLRDNPTEWEKVRFLDVDGNIPLGLKREDLFRRLEEITIRGRKRQSKINPPVNVLVIEPDNQCRQTIRLAFRFYWPESRVFLPASEQDGITLACKKPIDIILLDAGLPDLSVFEVLRRMRAVVQTPIILLMDNRDENIVIRAVKYGADDYMIKPVRPVELIARVRENIQRAAAVI